MNTPALSLEALANAVADLPEDRLAPQRRAALETLRRDALPTTRQEDWKYTDLTRVVEIGNRWLAAPREQRVPAEAIAAVCATIDAHWLVIANGSVDDDAVERAAGAGFEVSRLSTADVALTFDTPLGALNAALLRDGLRIRVPDGAQCTKPIGLLMIDSATTAGGIVQARIEIDIGENAAASLIEYHVSSGDADHYANTVVNLRLADGADAAYVRIQKRGFGHAQTNRLCVAQSRDSALRHCAFDLGGRLIRNDLVVDIRGAGATTECHGLYLGDGEQHIDNHTRAEHRVGPALSIQDYRGILSGKARCVWNGTAVVHAGADGTDATQANHNLLLSASAEVDTKPELEIYADEVKCAHGATVGQLDETALFYLQTRGIARDDARQMLTRAFGARVVGETPIEALRETVAALVDARLGDVVTADQS